MSVRSIFEMACPSCGDDRLLYIDATMRVRLLPDGSIDRDDAEWHDRNPMACGQCGRAGQVQDFRLDSEEGGCEP